MGKNDLQQEKNQSIETDPDMTEMIEDKDVKTASTNTFDILKKIKENTREKQKTQNKIKRNFYRTKNVIHKIQQSLIFLASGTGFVEANFSKDWSMCVWGELF